MNLFDSQSEPLGRDPQRIPEVLEAVQQFWEQNHTWSLGYLLHVVAESVQESVRGIEDDILVDSLKQFTIRESPHPEGEKDRIRPTLKEVESMWKRFPDWRLGQLVVNLAEHKSLELVDLKDIQLLNGAETFGLGISRPFNTGGDRLE